MVLSVEFKMISTRPISDALTNLRFNPAFILFHPHNSCPYVGAANKNMIGKLEGVNYRASRTSTAMNNLFAVRSSPFTSEDVLAAESTNDRKVTKIISETLDSQQLLRQKNVPTEFIHTFLYYNQKGDIYSEYTTHADLHHFITRDKNRFTLKEVKDFCGQIILAVADLLERNLVHRDIKPENFLVVERDGKFFIKLADLDTILEIDENGASLNQNPSPISTRTYAAPELISRTAFNLKAVDCFALGIVLKFMLNFALKAQDRLDVSNKSLINYLTELADKLSAKTAARRYSIEGAKNCKFFGATTEEREHFFIVLREKAKYTMIIDGMLFSPPAVNDAFYILDHNIKQLILLGYNVDAKYQEALAALANNVIPVSTVIILINLFKPLVRQILETLAKIQTEHPALFNNYAVQLEQIKLAISFENNRVEQLKNEKLQEKLVQCIDLCFSNFLQEINEMIRVSPMFANALMQQRLAAFTDVSMLKFIINNSENQQELFKKIAIITYPAGVARFKFLLKQNIEVVLGKSFDLYLKDLNLPSALEILRSGIAVTPVLASIRR
jgi:serine/threonine protein kinase